MKRLIIISITLLKLLGDAKSENVSSQLDSLKSLLKTAPNDSTRANIHQKIGSVYVSQGNYPEAIRCFLISQGLYITAKSEYGVFDCQNRLGVTYSFMNDCQTALKYLLTAKGGIDDGRLYDNLALVYYKQNDFDQSLSYYKKALDFYKGKVDKSSIGRLLNGIGSIYELKGNADTAIWYYHESLKVAEEIKDKISIVDAYASLGDAYFGKKEFYKSLEYEYKSLEMATSINYLMSIRETEKVLSDIYWELKDCESSLIHYKKYIAIKENLINEDNIKQIVRVEENFKFEKEKELARVEQEKKDAIKTEELRHQKNQRNIFIGCFAIVLCFSVFLFLTFKKTQRQKNIIEEQKKEVDESRREIMDNISYAKRIQDAVMTPLSQVRECLPDSFHLNMPRDTVSGDFLFVERHGNEIIVAVADCTNHSVSGAMMSLLCANLLGEAITDGNSTPSDILNYVNEAISKKFHQTDKDDAKGEMDVVKDGMDVVVISLDFENMHYQYAGAYNPLLIVRNNQLEEIKADKLQLGQTKLQYKNNAGELRKGDVLYLSSDGYADQFSSNGKKFMKKKFKELLLSIHDKTSDEQKSVLEKTISSWKNGCPQTDDILVMGIKI